MPCSEKWAHSGLQGRPCSASPLCPGKPGTGGGRRVLPAQGNCGPRGQGVCSKQGSDPRRGEGPEPSSSCGLCPAAPCASRALGVAVPEFREAPGGPHAPGGPQLVETQPPNIRSRARQGLGQTGWSDQDASRTCFSPQNRRDRVSELARSQKTRDHTAHFVSPGVCTKEAFGRLAEQKWL